MAATTNVIFFGSTSDSVLVLSALHQLSYANVTICCVVTQPPRPVGRDQTITPTPVNQWAKAHNIPILAFPNHPDRPSGYEDEQTVISALEPFKADLIVSASYGVKIPDSILKKTRHGGLNVHPSLLPRWRGADPVPWAIMTGDHQTGVTITTITDQFDEGLIIAQKKIPITLKDTSDPLRAKLFEMGAYLLTEILPDYLAGELDGHPQLASKGEALKGSPYARKFTREDGYEPWETITKACDDPEESARIERKFRALTPWPGLWSTVNEKRLKILDLTLDNGKLVVNTVQLEGKKPVPFTQFKTAYLQ